MNSESTNNGLATTPQEEILLIHLAAGFLAVLAGSVGVFWLKGATWLVEHGILVPAEAHPLLVVPGTGAAGLDVPRIAIAAAVVLAGLAAAASAVRRYWAERAVPE